MDQGWGAEVVAVVVVVAGVLGAGVVVSLIDLGTWWKWREMSGENSISRRSEGSLGADQQALLDGETEATVGGGVVEVGDAAGGDVAEDIGVVGLPLAIVALAVDGGADGVEEALTKLPVPMR